MEKAIDVPVWCKANLTIKEAAAYFNIGENRLSTLASLPNCDFSIHVGRKVLIKRKKFEEYLETVQEL